MSDAAYIKSKLSGSTNGRGIKIAATSGSGTLVHTAQAGTAGYDEVWLWGAISSTTAKLVQVQFGGTSDPDDMINDTVANKAGLKLLVPGLPLNNGLEVRVICETTNILTIFGFVNVITNP